MGKVIVRGSGTRPRSLPGVQYRKTGCFFRPDHFDADEEADHGAGEKQIAAQKTPPADR